MKYKRRRKKQKFPAKKRLTILTISLLTVIAAFVAIMGIGGIFTIEDGYLDLSQTIVEPVDKETGKINVLVVGLDNGGTRTDTIMIASYDLDNDKVNVLSVPRDTRMYIGSHYQKINSAYALSKKGKASGINGTIEAVTRLTAIPINYYVEFSCDAFRKTIDALGGVDFDVPRNMNYDDPVQNLHIHLTKGFQHLDGDHAEQLVRFRHYPMGDIDRVSVQQSFIKALCEQKLNATIITKLSDLFDVLKSDVKTNFKASDVTKYALNLADLSSENITAYSLPGTANSESYGASYWIPNMEEIKVLVQDTFGYDATDATIHSADGSSASKDVKKQESSGGNAKVSSGETKVKIDDTKVGTNKNSSTTKKDSTSKAATGEKQSESIDKTQKSSTTKTDTQKADSSKTGTTKTDTQKSDTQKKETESSEDKPKENTAEKTEPKKATRPTVDEDDFE